MQEQQTYGQRENPDPAAFMTSQGLVALLALTGSKRIGLEELRSRLNLSPQGFWKLLSVLQREYLVDVVSSLDGYQVKDSLVLTDVGERVLLGLLERTCELPEIR